MGQFRAYAEVKRWFSLEAQDCEEPATLSPDGLAHDDIAESAMLNVI